MQYRLYSMMCGDGVAGIANAPSSMFCATYYYMPAIHTLTPAVLNTTDGSDYGYDANLGNTSTFTAGSQVIQSDMQYFLLNQAFTAKIKFFNWTWPSTDASSSGTCDPLPDQITEGMWYYLVNNTAAQKQFQISARPGGAPLGPFTRSGQPYTGHVCNAFVRWDASVAATAPTAGLFFLSPAYAPYSLSSVTALVDINQSLGNIFPSASAILNNILARYAHNTQGWALQPGPGDATANNWWDPNVAVR